MTGRTIEEISFANIANGEKTTVRVTDDGMLFAVDLVMVMTGKNGNHSNECLRELDPLLFDQDNFIFQERSRLITLKNAISLIMILPGKIAKQTRALFADIIQRYIAGDRTMIIEIDANAASTSPIAQLAQASVDQDCDAGVKRRCEGLGGKQKLQDVSWAFDYQKEALELRHKRDLQLLENDYNEEIIQMEEKNDLLRKENAEAIEYIEKLKKELEILKQEDQEIMAQYNESMEHVRIWSSPYLHQLDLKNTP
jgi:hypothetical protein